MYMLILNFTYPLRCLRVPPVEYHCPRRNKFELKYRTPSDFTDVLTCTIAVMLQSYGHLWYANHGFRNKCWAL